MQDYHEVRLVLRVPRNSQPQASALPVSAAATAAAAAAPSQAPETALGVDGIELREQTHEEALLNTIGEQQLPTIVDGQAYSDWLFLSP